jgi:organic hydroperoxide reductase OsmC/OhrA
MPDSHVFRATIRWTGNLGSGTSGYREYSRDHEITSDGKSVTVPGSSAPAFRGDPARYNPEELVVAALSSCHMLWFLHLCAGAGIVVTGYEDAAEGEMVVRRGGEGNIVRAVMHPKVQLADPARAPELAALHQKAHELCFIARSVNFPVEVQAEILE